MGKRATNSIWRNKCRLIRLPVLHLPNSTGGFHLYSDTSKFAMGSAIYQIQNGKPKLISYTSKRLPEAVKSYSITELELCGLAINIASFFSFIKKTRFWCDSREISMIKETIRICAGQIVEIEEYNLMVEFKMDRIIEVD